MGIYVQCTVAGMVVDEVAISTANIGIDEYTAADIVSMKYNYRLRR